MKTAHTTFFATFAALLAAANTFAPTQVPDISALEVTAALAAVAAIVLLA